MIKDQHPFITVFCQGNTTARSQAAKYRDSVKYIRSDGKIEEAGTRNTVFDNLLARFYVWPDLEDVGYGWTWWPLYTLSYIKSILSLWWFSIFGASWTYVRYDKVNVAGPRDVQQYVNAVRQCIRENPEKRVVLFGCSRGASTVLCALPQLSSEEHSHIALVMVEAPFDSLDHVFKCWHGVRWGTLALSLFQRLTAFRRDQQTPLQAVKSEAFPLHLPLAFVVSEADSTVPVECTMEIVNALLKRGHSDMHLLALEQSHHSEMPSGKERKYYRLFSQEMHERVLLQQDYCLTL